jgi:hypothetical protein
MSLADLLSKFDKRDDRYLMSVRSLVSSEQARAATQVFEEVIARKTSVENVNAMLRERARRFDNLYFPQTFTTGGADHWPEHAVENIGRVHISLNVYPIYVEIPAALQSQQPQERILAQSNDEDARQAADDVERLYFAWKREDNIELKDHQACLVKALYGYTFTKIELDPVARIPRTRIIELPHNLYVTWDSTDYTRMRSCVYVYQMSVDAALERYPVDIFGVDLKGERFAFALPIDTLEAGTTHADPLGQQLNYRKLSKGSPYLQDLITIYDYWVIKDGKVIEAVFCGGALVKLKDHPEFDDLPYLILPNTFIPGWPYGKPELYDIEQLIREKEERLSNIGQLIASTTEGQRWQLVGPEAPASIADDLFPPPDSIVAPGAGNRIEPIVPFIPEVQSMDYVRKLDDEIENITGLNEVLRGKAPAAVLGSSKAIAALVSQYEVRMSMKRALFYAWRKKRWEMCARAWARADSAVRSIFERGGIELDQQPPDLTPRDKFEIATMAVNLVNARIWSMERAMTATGVDDATGEKDVIRSEQSDAALQPAAAQAQLQLYAIAQQLGVQQQQQSIQQQAQEAGNQLYAGLNAMNQPPSNEAQTPTPISSNAQQQLLLQTMLQKGQVSGRILSQQPISITPNETEQ